MPDARKGKRKKVSAAVATKARRRLAKAIARGRPASLEVIDVGPEADEWVVLRFDDSRHGEERPEQSALPAALRDVLAGIMKGETNAEIAARRGTSVRTVDNQVAALLARFEVSTRVELVRRLIRL